MNSIFWKPLKVWSDWTNLLLKIQIENFANCKTESGLNLRWHCPAASYRPATSEIESEIKTLRHCQCRSAEYLDSQDPSFHINVVLNETDLLLVLSPRPVFELQNKKEKSFLLNPLLNKAINMKRAAHSYYELPRAPLHIQMLLPRVALPANSACCRGKNFEIISFTP